MDLQKIQAYMQQEGIGAWLVYDFRGGNPVLWQLLGQRRQTTRRVFLIVPAAGAPRLLGSAVEPEALARLGVEIAHYASWEQLHALLRDAVGGLSQVAMEYWPGGALPTVSWVDGGTLELVRSLGPEVVSSANLCQVALATWSADALASHRDACRQVAEVKDAAFEHIRSRASHRPHRIRRPGVHRRRIGAARPRHRASADCRRQWQQRQSALRAECGHCRPH